MADLRERLTAIDGVGDARAEEIIEVLNDTPKPRDENVYNARSELEDALEYIDAGETEYATKYVRRAYDALADG